MINVILWMVAIILGLIILSALVKGFIVTIAVITMFIEEYKKQKQFDKWRDK